MSTQAPVDRPITGMTTVREAVTRYPGIEAVFEKHGIMGCGGPQGPIEFIAFFARVHRVAPEVLLPELNDFALGKGPSTPADETVMVASEQRSFYFVPITTAVLLALLAGLPLGILAAFSAVHDIGITRRWLPLVQAHGHLQVMGWVGLFIMGVAYHVLPRFKGVSLRPARLVWPSFLLLLAGVLLRTVSQPWGDVSWVSGLLVLSAALELAGAAAFAVVVAGTVGAGRREAYDVFLLAAVVWLVAASVANLVVLVDTVGAGAAVIAQNKDEPLLAMQLYGFITLFILGVSLRVLPVFLNLRPTRTRALALVLLLFNAGLALRLASRWTTAYAGWNPPEAVEAAAAYMLAAAVFVFVFALNVHLPSLKSDIADQERAYGKLVRAAYVWLVAAAAFDLWFTSRALTGGDGATWLEAGGVRHALALGFITQMMFGVAFRALPVFAGKKLYSQRLVDVTFVLINVAAVTRVAPAIIDAGSATSRYDHIGAAGGLAWLAVALFTYNIVRTVRGPSAPSAPAYHSPGGANMTDHSDRRQFVVTPSTLVAEVLERLPRSLEVLLSYGFTPLADPAMREAMAPRVTLDQASQIHPVDLEALLRDLNALASAAATGAPAPARDTHQAGLARDATRIRPAVDGVRNEEADVGRWEEKR